MKTLYYLNKSMLFILSSGLASMLSIILFTMIVFVSGNALADHHHLYDNYGYGSRYNVQPVYPDNVQLYIMQKQAERMQKENHDYAVRQGLKDAWRGDGGSAYDYQPRVRY